MVLRPSKNQPIPTETGLIDQIPFFFEPLKAFLHSEEFAEKARMSEMDFTRQRALPLPLLVTLLLNLRKGSNEDELSHFFEVVAEQPLADSVTSSALCQARRKLKPSAFMQLNTQLIASFLAHFSPRRWHGLRLLAVDGSTARLPNTADIVATFGEPPRGSSVPLARFSRLYDVLNGLVLEADIEPYHVGERVLAGEHLAATLADDLLLYDRGYPAFWLFAHHRQEQRHFCARLSLSFSTEVERFLADGRKSEVVAFEPGSEARKQCAMYGLPGDPLRLRLIRVQLKSGEIEVLATSLLDEADFPTAWFKSLYHLRWGVEEGYKREKCRLEIENFSGLSTHVVQQDFYAKIFAMNLTAALTWVAQAIADRLYRERKHAYRVNFANALSRMKDNLVRLFLSASPNGLLASLVRSMALCVEAVRPDRSAPRNVKPAKLHGFHRNYKRCR